MVHCVHTTRFLPQGHGMATPFSKKLSVNASCKSCSESTPREKLDCVRAQAGSHSELVIARSRNAAASSNVRVCRTLLMDQAVMWYRHQSDAAWERRLYERVQIEAIRNKMPHERCDHIKEYYWHHDEVFDVGRERYSGQTVSSSFNKMRNKHCENAADMKNGN